MNIQTTPEEQERLDEAKNILAKVKIQAQPKILIELNRLARSEDVNFNLVSDLVAKDVGLSAKMLNLPPLRCIPGGRNLVRCMRP